MTVDHLLEPLLQSMGTGVAVADPDSLEILFENARFLGWLKPNGAESNQLPGRVRGLDVARMRARLEQRRPFLHETEIKEGARTIKLGLEIRQELLGGRALLLVEVRDVSKLKETEYMLDSYTRLAETHARELESEKERVEKLLLNIMPRAVYDEIKDFGAATPQRFPEASILMLDFVDFTQRTGASDPSAIVAELNDIFSAFDRIVAMYDCERIKAVGDAYMAVSGLPEANAGHAVSVARAATRMRRYIQGRNTSHGLRWQCRVGLATGPVLLFI